jgi:NADPH-dependent 2,4-dienoyl-CoA reductase/sulfur reductase-like enzyme
MSRLLVVGGDAAGMSAASHVARERPDVAITVVERGPYTSYSMCGIPYYVGGEVDDADDLVARAPEQFRAMGMTVHLRTEAVAVDAHARTVRVRDLERGGERDEPYDALLIATGAHPQLPPLPGLDEFGHVVHTLDEGEHLRRHLEEHREVHRVVVVGAGYIGLEIAEALVRRGLDTLLLDRSPQVMKSLDPDMAALVQQRLEAFGVRVHLGESLEAVEGTDDCCNAVVTDAGRYQADTVVLAMGGKPNLGLARSAGCAIGPSGGIVVDGRMRTSVPGIWAAGDCVESRDLVVGLRVNVQLGTHANKQGKVAGVDLAAQPGFGDAVFPGVVGTAVTKLCEWEIGRTGATEAEARAAGVDYEAVTLVGSARAGYMPDAGEVHVKLLAEVGTGRVIGCQLVGSGNVAKRIDVAAMWCQLRVPVQQAQLLDLSYAPPFGGVWDLLQVAARKLTRQLGLSPQL